MDGEGRVNLAPFSYFNALSADPPMVVFGPNAKNVQEAKDTYRNVLEVPEFVVNIVGAELKEQMIATSEPVDRGINEMELAGLTAAESINIGPPRIAEASAALECVVYRTGDFPPGHDGRIGHFVIGQVVGVHIDDSVIRDGKVDETLIRHISRLGYFNYNEVKDVFFMKRPA
jgi:flavin reductase (DIM6/NTAB) family NADH-FMN oxidoreductase RutF